LEPDLKAKKVFAYVLVLTPDLKDGEYVETEVKNGIKTETKWFRKTLTTPKTYSSGFKFEESATIKSELQAVKFYYTEFMPQLECGIPDPSATVPKFIDKLKSAGIDKIVFEAQRQYESYAAKNK
jgi:hypothetical protein